MKTTSQLLLAALISAGLMTSALTAGAAGKAAKGDKAAKTTAVQGRLQQMSEQLNLTDEQKEKIKPILQEQMEKQKTLRTDTSLTPEQKKEKAKELRTELTQKLKPILTPEQFEKWQKQARSTATQRGAKKDKAR